MILVTDRWGSCKHLRKPIPMDYQGHRVKDEAVYTVADCSVLNWTLKTKEKYDSF